MFKQAHPVLGFSSVFGLCTGLLIAAIALLAILAQPFFEKLSTSGFLNFLPFVSSFFATQVAVRSDRFRLSDVSRTARRQSFAWAVGFGVLGMAITIGIAAALWGLQITGAPKLSVVAVLILSAGHIAVCYHAIQQELQNRPGARDIAEAAEADPTIAMSVAARRAGRDFKPNN